MRYFVLAHDGGRYGPADIPTLNQWAAEGRVRPETMLQSDADGRTVRAADLPGLVFAPPQAAYGVPPPGVDAGYPYPTRYPTPVAPYLNAGVTELNLAWGFSIASAGLMVFCCANILAAVPALIAFLLASTAMAKGQRRAGGPMALSLIVLALVALGASLHIHPF